MLQRKMIVALIVGSLGAGPAMAQVLHAFPATPGDGDFLLGSVIISEDGTLYGTTAGGGTL